MHDHPSTDPAGDQRPSATPPPVPGEGLDSRLSPTQQLAAVRAILVGPEQDQLRSIKKRLDDPAARARDLANALPDAIKIRSGMDQALAKALAPTLEKSIHASVQKNPQPLVDAIFPVIGPAIRKAISETLAGLLAGFSAALETGFSWRGLTWRIEAWRTGKSFAEVVLLRTLVYRVEQVFLIHRGTGLVLQHVTHPQVIAQDADTVAAMLTALQDFVRDSFAADKNEGLETIKVGSKLVWIEGGPYAVLAAVVQGTPQHALREQMQDALARIHLELGDAMSAFSGDAAPLAPAQPILASCLVQASRQQVEKRRISWIVWAIIAAVVLALAWWIISSSLESRRWNRLVAALRATPGYVITAHGPFRATNQPGENKHRFVQGLRDPITPEPAELIRSFGFDPDAIDLRLEPYQSLDPAFVLARAEPILKPPKTIKLSLAGSVLVIAGSADHAWITSARRLVGQIPGVIAIRDSALIDTDLTRLEEIRAVVERLQVRFVFASTQLLPDQELTLDNMASLLSEVVAIAEPAGIEPAIQVVGATDGTGAEERNVRLSRDRADRLVTLLVARGVPSRAISAVGVGSTLPVAQETDETQRERNRYASIRVVFQEAPLRVTR